MRYPKALPEGGTIGFVAPSFGCNREPYYSAFENAKENWASAGFQLDLGPNVYAGEGIGISNTPQKCAAEFMEWYLKKDNDVLISCGGGELMCEILEHIDFKKLKEADPKWFMGYSDNTNMTFLLNTICDVASIYGPCAATFGMEPWCENLDDAMGLLCDEKRSVHGYPLWEIEGTKSEESPLDPYNLTEKKVIHSFVGDREISRRRKLQMTGRLIGGCLDILQLQCGTKFDHVKEFAEKYKKDGIIWVFEACDLNPLGIRRALWQLDQAGWFKHVKGFLIGRPYLFGMDIMGMDQYNSVLGVLGKYNVPIIMDADFGHLPPAMPVVMGSVATATIRGNKITIDMEYK